MPRHNVVAYAGIGALLLAGLVAIGTGCTNNTISTTQVDFYGPAGLAIAPARDRDLLFISSPGGDDLKAITICNTPSLLADGGASFTTCTDQEDFHFLPGPIRVFPGSFPVGNRPMHMAPVNLRDADGGVVGGILVAGVATSTSADGGVADGGAGELVSALKLVDSVNILDATQGAATIKVPGNIPLDGPPIDVVSLEITGALPPPTVNGVVPLNQGIANPPANGAAQPAFVLTQANLTSGIPAEISMLSMTSSSDGPVASLVGRCSLDILASRLALIPGALGYPDGDAGVPYPIANPLHLPDGGVDPDPPPQQLPLLLYVGDASTDNVVPGGRGDGVLEIDTATIPAVSSSVAPCTINRRLPATDPATGLARGITALALSPAYSSNDVIETDGGYRDYPAGALLLGVSTDGVIVFIRTDTGRAPAIPPFESLRDGGTFSNTSGPTVYVLDDGGVGFVLTDGGVTLIDGLAAQPMEPLRLNGLAREITFLKDPPVCPSGTSGPAPCILVEVGVTEGTTTNTTFPLVAVVTSSDGTAVFIDPDQKRFLSDLRDATPGSQGLQAAVDTSYTFAPAQPNDQAAPTLTFAPADTTTNECSRMPTTSGVSNAPVECLPLGWSGAGVARQSAWRAVWHAAAQGLERQGGTLTVEDPTHVRFTMPGVDTTRWTNPLLNDPLDIGDVVSFAAFSTPDSTPTNPNGSLCQKLVTENSNPLVREFTITAIGNTTGADGSLEGYFLLLSSTPSPYNQTNDALDLADLADPMIAACYPTTPGFGLGGVAEVRYAGGLVTSDAPGGHPWLIYQGNLIHGRAATGVQFVGTETRFDYPLVYELYIDNLSLLPTIANDIGVAFTITAPDPVTAQATLAWTVASGQSPTRVSDTNVLGGFAGPVISYNSAKIPGNLVFFSSTGTNSVIQVDPALVGVVNGIIEYR